MTTKTSIEWTEFTWNFLRGCSRVSEGCRNCYAETIAGRFSGEGMPYHGLATMNGEARWTGEISFDEKTLLAPLKRKKPTVYFVNSMSDLFHEKVKDEWLDKAFAVMALCPQHTFQILTKRPERMRDYFRKASDEWKDFGVSQYADEVSNNGLLVCERGDLKPHIEKAGWDVEWIPNKGKLDQPTLVYLGKVPLPNVWLGVSVENQQTADERIPYLLQTPAAIRFLSCEPLLGEIDLTFVGCPNCGHSKNSWFPNYVFCRHCKQHVKFPPNEIHWVIAGGESGNKARACDLEWIRLIVRQCEECDVPVFVKQLGKMPIRKAESENEILYENYLTSHGINDAPEGFLSLAISDKKGGKIEEFPKDLQIRQMPV